MKLYSRQPENQSRVTEHVSKASQQASTAEILQAYRDGTLGKQPVQRESKEDEELIQGKFDTAQREEIDEDELLQGKFASAPTTEQKTIQREDKPNKTGLPDSLKTGIENLSGYSMDDVRVHYNSDKPAQLQALAYAQGTDIHIAPGQEKHLPHEAWHVVQQKQGRVQPTMQLQGVNVNDNEGLEKEADVIESKIIQAKWIQVDEVKYKWDEIIDGITWYVNIKGEFFKEGTKTSKGDDEEKDFNEIIDSQIGLYEYLLKTRMKLSPDDITTFVDIVTVYAQNIHRAIRLKYDNQTIGESIDNYMTGFGKSKEINKSAFQKCLNTFFSKPQKKYNDLIELCSQIIAEQYFSEGNNRTAYGIMILLGRIYNIQIPPADIVLSRPKIRPLKSKIINQFTEMRPPFF